MPHITIEYSSNLETHHDINALVGAVHDAAIAHGLPPMDGLRTRAVARSHYRIANGDADLAFVAIHIRIGPGRDAETRTSFLNDVLDAAQGQLAGESTHFAISWSIELGEIIPENRINRNEVRARLQARATG